MVIVEEFPMIPEASRNILERIARSNIQQSRHQTLFIPKEGRENIEKTQRETDKWVMKSVMQGEGIGTPHIHSSPWRSF